MTRWERRPTAAELGEAVTICIAAVTQPDGHFVAVSDHMISYSDVFPADDQGARKILQIGDHWHAMFSDDPAAFKRVILMVMRTLKETEDNAGCHSYETVRDAVLKAYSQVFEEEFVALNLSKLGYRTLEEFRKQGLAELGRDIFREHHEALMKFDLRVQIVIFGYDQKFRPHMFEVSTPGQVSDRMLAGYSVLGSGYHMAMGSLTYRPLTRRLEDLIWRLLEAKFSAETASGVGDSTALLTVSKDGVPIQMAPSQIEALRDLWKARRRESTPTEALEIISKASVVRSIYG